MSGTPPADPPENGPDGDAFYEIEEIVPTGDPGDPIYQRMLANPAAALDGRNWLVLYRSDNAQTRRATICRPTQATRTSIRTGSTRSSNT